MTKASLSLFEAAKQGSLAGEWKFNNTIWYTSELTLQDNGIFKFHDQGCYGQIFTEGRWTESDGTILLSSNDTYKPIKKIEEKQKQTVEQSSKKHKSKKGKLIFTGFENTEVPKLNGTNDTIRVYFENVHLSIRGDTLYCIDKNKYITEHKFGKTKTTVNSIF